MSSEKTKKKAFFFKKIHFFGNMAHFQWFLEL